MSGEKFNKSLRFFPDFIKTNNIIFFDAYQSILPWHPDDFGPKDLLILIK
jgi:hypothetical protein